MPITPIHFGVGILAKSAAEKRFSLSMFALANIAIDIEPITWYLLTGDPVHGFLHTMLGATLLALACAHWGRSWCEMLLRLWNVQLSARQATWLDVVPSISTGSAFVSALVGAWSHVVLDSFMHADVRPCWPLSDANDILGLVPLNYVYFFSALFGVWGMLRLVTIRWDSIRKNQAGDGNGSGRSWAATASSMVARFFAGFTRSLVGFCTLVWLVLAPFYISAEKDTARDRFDAESWKAATAWRHKGGNPRYFMTQDLIRQLDRQRPTNHEVSLLLGSPDFPHAPMNASYWVGKPDYGISGAYVFEIRFDQAGQYLGARTYSD